ncbi:MAG: NADH-cytochrome b5 reductase [Chrysothrix sp. TS-e1954]|nr:MAG: NADH-cytochrome b5 reductase [Chrysothrix sp. TS-e1954]
MATPQYIGGVYLPLVIVLAAAAARQEWIPYAFITAALVSAVSFFALSVDTPSAITKGIGSGSTGVLNPSEFQQYPLSEKTVLSYNTAIYRFRLPKSSDILGLPIGQHISLAAHIEGQEKEVVRSYTPISSDEDRGYFDLIIKSYPQGNISKHVGALKIGETMQVRGPKGAMVYSPNMVRHIGMIAGGTGITPMLQIVRAIVRGRARNGGSDQTRVDLIFANVNHDDILLKDDLDQLAREDDGFQVYYVLNNPPAGWTGGTGFVTPDMIKDSQAKFPSPAKDTKVLLCGPPPMVSAMKKATESLSYEKPRAVSKLDDQVFCF